MKADFTFGNNDLEKKNYGVVENNLRKYFQQRQEKYLSIFKNNRQPCNCRFKKIKLLL
ncbi:MAG TPA: hypothetical protein VIK78_04455 [Ruminiclostridium sp.]